MTRKDKCDACRKGKIKCDESLPSCSNCVQRGKQCTHSGKRRSFKFVEVTGETVNEHWNTDTDRKVALITTHRRREPPKLPWGAGLAAAENLVRYDLSSRPSETVSLLTRWFSIMPSREATAEDYLSGGDGVWASHIPLLIGRSRAMDDAARCFLDCKQAFANPSAANIRAAEASNLAAVSSVRLALLEGGPHFCTSDILLAIQTLVLVESLMFHTRNCFMIHIKGLLSLLRKHQDRLWRGNSHDLQISRAILLANCGSGFYAAVQDKRDHDLDQPGWLDMAVMAFKIPGASDAAVQSCGSSVVQSFVLLPRLMRLVRQVVKQRDEDGAAEREAIELARTLALKKRTTDLFYEAVTAGEMQQETTVLPGLAEEIPTSYRFGSTALNTLLVVYWWARLLVCGLVGTLAEASPTAALFFDPASVYAEDVRTATEGLMAAQCSLVGSLSPGNPAKLLAERMRLANLLRDSWAAWRRLEVRAGASLAVEEVARACRMKKLSFDLLNQVSELVGFNQSVEATLEMQALFLAGRI